jgi:hypothetical protein
LVRRFVVTVQLARGAEKKVREILREGPPFDLEGSSLERHFVFVASDELVFLFEGDGADEEAERLLKDPRVLGEAGRIRAYLAGKPRVPEEVFGWERPESLDGLSFGPEPGPGDSEGGGVD